MLDGVYDISADIPSGSKKGTATLTTHGDELLVEISVGLLGTLKGTGSVKGNTFAVSGSHKVLLLGDITYKVEGIVEGNTLQALCDTNKGTIVVTGTRR